MPRNLTAETLVRIESRIVMLLNVFFWLEIIIFEVSYVFPIHCGMSNINVTVRNKTFSTRFQKEKKSLYINEVHLALQCVHTDI